MKISHNIKNILKITLIYIFFYISVLFLLKDISKFSYLPTYMQKYKYSAILFGLAFPVLIRIFNVEFKYIFKFYIFIMITLLFSLVNLSLYTQYATTPDPLMFPICTILSVIISYPFTSVIVTLVGYNLSNLSYIAVPLYVGLLLGLSYILNKIRFNKNK